MLITVMSEGELHVPRLGRVAASPGFRLVAAMNPFDAIGTARISRRGLRPRVPAGGRLPDARPTRRRSSRARRGATAARSGVGRQGRRARAAHPDPSRPARRLVGARRDRHVRRGARRWRRCAGSRRRDPSVSASTPRWSRCPAGCGCARAPAGRPRTSSPSCGRRCSAGRDGDGEAREKLAPRLGPPAPA